MDVFNGWIIHLVNQDQLKQEDSKHDIKLRRIFKITILENITKNNNLVEQDQKRQIKDRLLLLLAGDKIKKFLFLIFKIKTQKISRSLNKIENLVFRGIEDDDFIVQVEIILEAEDVHGVFGDLV
jgi:hypothetical protein